MINAAKAQEITKDIKEINEIAMKYTEQISEEILKIAQGGGSQFAFYLDKIRKEAGDKLFGFVRDKMIKTFEDAGYKVIQNGLDSAQVIWWE